MEKVDYMMNTLQTLLERRNFQISELFKVLNANSEDEIIDQLFLSLNKTIEVSPEKYKEYIEIYTKIVLMLIENCPNVNYKEAKKRIIKLNDKTLTNTTINNGVLYAILDTQTQKVGNHKITVKLGEGKLYNAQEFNINLTINK